MKYVCKQINPEYQESPLFYNGFDNGEIDTDDTYNNLFLIPAKNCYGIKNKQFETIFDAVAELADEWSNIKEKSNYANYHTITEALNDMLPKENNKSYTTKEVNRWKEILEKDYFEITDDDKCEVLSLIYGGEWNNTQITGCCQGDWAEVFYKTNMWTDETIDILEKEYFNLGSEWLCDFDGIDNEEAEEITSDFEIETPVGIYAYNWDNDKIKSELADEIGCDTEDIIMFKYSGKVYINTYERV